MIEYGTIHAFESHWSMVQILLNKPIAFEVASAADERYIR